MFYHEGMKRSTGNVAREVFGMVSVTQEGLKAFSHLLNDESAFEKLFSHDADDVVRFLDTLYHKQGEQGRDLFTAALLKSNIALRLVSYNQAKWFVGKIKDFDNDQVTEILSAPHIVLALSKRDHGRWIADKIDTLDSIDQVERIISAPNAVRGLTDAGLGLWLKRKQAEIQAIRSSFDMISQGTPPASPAP